MSRKLPPKEAVKKKPLTKLTKADHTIAQKRFKQIVSGEYEKYNVNKHVPLLLKLFAKGGDICHFCAEGGVVRSTFHLWVKKYKTFTRAYEVAKDLAFRNWLDKLPDDLNDEDGKRFNTKIWNLIMMNRFGFTAQRKVCLPKLKKCKTPEAQLKCIIGYISDGELTTQESSQLATIILTVLKVDENTTMKARLEQAEEIIKDLI